MLAFIQVLLTFFLLSNTATARGRRHGFDRPNPSGSSPGPSSIPVPYPSNSSTGASPDPSSGPSSSRRPVENSGKRGLSYNDATLTGPFSLSGQHSRVSWAYNYYSFPYTIGQNQSDFNPALNFVPMLWSAAKDLTDLWETNVNKSIAEYNTTAVLAFHEPDLCGYGGSCMSLSDAVIAYRQYMNPLAGLVKLGAPAVTNGAGSLGLNWLRSFLSQCTDCHIDFVPIHWYGDAKNTSSFESHVKEAHRVAKGRPLWLTDFGTTGGTANEIRTFLQRAMPWLDRTPYVEKYAYFTDKVGTLINNNGSGLSDLGKLYNSGRLFNRINDNEPGVQDQ